MKSENYRKKWATCQGKEKAASTRAREIFASVGKEFQVEKATYKGEWRIILVRAQGSYEYVDTVVSM